MALSRPSDLGLGLSLVLIGTLLSVSFKLSSRTRRLVMNAKDSALRSCEGYIQRLFSPSATFPWSHDMVDNLPFPPHLRHVRPA